MDPTALFLGPQGQNADTLERVLLEVLRDHVHWRRGFHAEDPDAVDPFRQLSPDFQSTRARMEASLRRLLARLKGSVPSHSPRYLGHMTGDTLLPGQAGYVAAMLYNPNNGAYEGSPVTTLLEQEVAADFASLLGYSPETSSGHLCSGGTVANIEALWTLRNLALLPLGVDRSDPDSLPDLRDAGGWPVDWKADPGHLLGRLDAEALLALSSHRVTRPAHALSMAVLVPATRHFSWDKAMNLLGFSSEDLVRIPLDSELRLDPDALEAELDRLGREDRPVLACVGVVGSTETGGVDPVHRIFEARRRFQERFGRWFFVHLDAAYGGYARALFLRADGNLRTEEELASEGLEVRPELIEAMAAVPQADSVTIDPHKLGFVPYPAGAIVLRDARFRRATRFGAAYINADHDDHISAFALEGSRPGAAVAACWLAHRTVPLDETGYGAILRESFRSARGLAELLDGRGFEGVRCHVLQPPDLDIVLYAFSPEGGGTLDEVNHLQRRILTRLNPTAGGPFAISSTRITPEVHGESILPYLDRLGVAREAWRPGAGLTLLRSVMMTPFVADAEVKAYYRARLVEALDETLRGAMAERGIRTPRAAVG